MRIPINHFCFFLTVNVKNWDIFNIIDISSITSPFIKNVPHVVF